MEQPTTPPSQQPKPSPQLDPAQQPRTPEQSTAAPLSSSGPSGSFANPARTAKRLQIAVLIVVLLGAAGGAAWYFTRPAKPAASKTAASASPSPSASTEQSASSLAGKNYGDKYSNGLLPVGDNKYSSTAAKKGYIYTCSGYASNLAKGGGGASARGPWFVGTTQWDINKKVSVGGHVNWTPSLSNTLSGGKRIITTNDLPNHYTGTYPISASDPAYAYDRNPNSIKAQSMTYSLDANPTAGGPNCMGGQSGVMLTGVAIFNGFDAGGRDAGAWEVQDGCSGHPERSGTYHYHTLSKCITDTSVSTVIGFALDGFPITGPKVGTGNILTTDDLDECHGITSDITLDGKKVTMYHYVMTQDFPYSVSCFRGTAIRPPGQP